MLSKIKIKRPSHTCWNRSRMRSEMLMHLAASNEKCKGKIFTWTMIFTMSRASVFSCPLYKSNRRYSTQEAQCNNRSYSTRETQCNKAYASRRLYCPPTCKNFRASCPLSMFFRQRYTKRHSVSQVQSALRGSAIYVPPSRSSRPRTKALHPSN